VRASKTKKRRGKTSMKRKGEEDQDLVEIPFIKMHKLKGITLDL